MSHRVPRCACYRGVHLLVFFGLRGRVTVVFYDLIHGGDSIKTFFSGKFLLGRSGSQVAGTGDHVAVFPGSWIGMHHGC